jgi:GAF domain-containing protein
MEAAEELLKEARAAAKGIEDNPAVAGGLEDTAAGISHKRGDLRAAIKSYERALKYVDAGTKFASLAPLADAHLEAGKPRAALAATREGTRLHRSLNFATPSGDGSPSHIWLAHSRALRATGDEAGAAEALETAYRLMIESIANLKDEGIRRSYLCHVQVHRDLVLDWLEHARAKRLSTERATAHLRGEVSLGEPFERLVDTGLRLNELRSAAELHEFLIEEVTELIGAERVLLVLEEDGKRTLAGSHVPPGEDAGRLFTKAKGALDEARRARTAQLSYSPASGAALRQRSVMVAPLVAEREVRGYLYADIDGAFGRFGESDRDLLNMLASQAAVALANARWSQSLEQKVERRTEELKVSNAELEQRADELAVINSIQQGIAANLDFEGIIDLVGDKLRAVFKTDPRDSLVGSGSAKPPSGSTSTSMGSASTGWKRMRLQKGRAYVQGAHDEGRAGD